MKIDRVYAEPWQDYELLDAGGGKKLERFGEIITIRPELQAYFKSGLPFTEWETMSHASFVESKGRNGKWKFTEENISQNWNINFEALKFKLEFTKFKHVGIFPEQVYNWNFLQKNLQKEDKFLNLFAYTGAASLVARSCGAQVTHIDAVKQLVSWSKENMELSGLSDIRCLVDDAMKFAQKEVNRGNKYKGIIMDPPAFGLGSKGEKWILDQQLEGLLDLAKNLLEKDGFLIVNTYSPKIDAAKLLELANRKFTKSDIKVQELWMKTKTGKDLYFGNLLKIMNYEL